MVSAGERVGHLSRWQGPLVRLARANRIPLLFLRDRTSVWVDSGWSHRCRRVGLEAFLECPHSLGAAFNLKIASQLLGRSSVGAVPCMFAGPVGLRRRCEAGAYF